MPDVLIALGSNLGDRRAYLREAVRGLSAGGCKIVGGSALYVTAAVGIAGGGEFLNAVVSGRTQLTARELLRLCLQIEGEAGRRRAGAEAHGDHALHPLEGRWLSRTLDLDLLRYGDAEIHEPDLVVPHPRLTERAFVLAPLREVAPDWIVRGRAVSAWYMEAPVAGVRRVNGSRHWFGHFSP